MTFSCASCGTDSGTRLVCRDCIPKLSAYKYKKVMDAWHKIVVERDGCECVYCGFSDEAKNGTLCGNHKKTRNNAPDLVFDIDNGECICMPCNGKHSYSASTERKKEIEKERKTRPKKTLCSKCRMFLAVFDGKCIKCH